MTDNEKVQFFAAILVSNNGFLQIPRLLLFHVDNFPSPSIGALLEYHKHLVWNTVTSSSMEFCSQVIKIREVYG